MIHKRPVRRGHLITPWGVGAMVDFPEDESLMTCGLDVWPLATSTCPNDMKVIEERLQKRLGVSHFRLPPEYADHQSGIQYPYSRVPFIRFPQWHYCPKCGSMEKLSIYGERQRCKGPNYATGMSCYSTQQFRRPYIIPLRFVAICARGHIEDFPVMEWVHRGNRCDETHKLRHRAGRSASTLSGIVINCSCGVQRSMAGAFNQHSLKNIRACGGHRPWLGGIEDDTIICGGELHVVQRGASNAYFPEIMSSIYLPHWGSSLDHKMVQVFEKHWSYLTDGLVNGKLDQARFEAIAELYQIDYGTLMDGAIKRLESSSCHTLQPDDSEELYRKAEYNAILSRMGGDNQDFFVVNVDIQRYGDVIRQHFRSISLIHKLRETRVFTGFSRLLPDDGRKLQERKMDLALGTISWLPTIVVRGEGIFFEFDNEKLAQWSESNKTVKDRAEMLVNNYNKLRRKLGQPSRLLNARFILLHTFAHVLINQFSFACGYGSSAIRERIYYSTENTSEPMNGVLIYTASGDSEGSLGGLVRQGKPGYIEDIITSSLYAAQWCSSDPVCIQSHGQGPDSCNLAACHSCALLPETCCEEGNRLLDRAMLIGTLDQTEIGFFNSFLEGHIPESAATETTSSGPSNYHDQCVANISKHLGISMIEQANCVYTSSDKRYHIVCLVSKLYQRENLARYWYAFHPAQAEFLREGEHSYVAFGCGSADHTLLIPKEAFLPLLDNMRTTKSEKRFYWHVEIFEKGAQILIGSPNIAKGIDVTHYLIA